MVRAEKRKYHYIYKILCNVTNRYYIGMHSTDNLDDEYFGSGKRLWFSIQYHGKENHTKEIIEFLPSRKLLKEREEQIVNKKILDDDLCMNLKIGGEGGFINDTHKENFFKGQRKYLDGLRFDNEKFKNHCLTFENIKKASRLNGKLITNIQNNYNWLGKKHTEETKHKMRKSKNVGESNSQYGTCWITKDCVNKKIKKEDLNSFINDEWVKGRYIESKGGKWCPRLFAKQ
jgi:hypothetical protein